jgi:hypothetical protein
MDNEIADVGIGVVYIIYENCMQSTAGQSMNINILIELGPRLKH